MTKLLLRLATWLHPDTKNLHTLAQVAILGNLLGMLYGIPLAVIGMAWLSLATDITVLLDNWLLLAVLTVTGIVIEEWNFYMIVRLGNISGGGSFYGSLSSIITLASAFILGFSGLWVGVIRIITSMVRNRNQLKTAPDNWQELRNYSFAMADVTLMNLIAFTIYENAGGAIPFSELSAQTIPLALAAVVLRLLLAESLSFPYITYVGAKIADLSTTSIREIYVFTFISMVVVALIQPFSILAAGIYSEMGWSGFAFFLLAILSTSWMSNRLSRAVERSNQRTRELSKLEQLSRAIIDAPPDASSLPELLGQHVPEMFSQSNIVIHIFPDMQLYSGPGVQLQVPPAFWRWLRNTERVGCVLANEPPPWNKENIDYRARLYTPIFDPDTNRVIGGIYLVSFHLDKSGIVHSLPAAQSLAAQVASALHSAKVYRQTLEHEKTMQELMLAGRIQHSFLPESIPVIEGWQLSAMLNPARQTSGDFYDIFSLPDNRIGFLVADVADKGVGAALYMALSRTLIRTYARQFDQPNIALQMANDRILEDTQSDLFVTVFYAVLDLASGQLLYCNAGHNPAYVSDRNGMKRLMRTGIPLGMFQSVEWKSKTISLTPGALLTIYSDGLTEAHNAGDELFGEQRLKSILQQYNHATTEQLKNKIQTEITSFIGDMPQFDDITLLLIKREKEELADLHHGPKDSINSVSSEGSSGGNAL